MGDIDGLAQIIVGAQLHGRHRVGDIAFAGDHHHRQVQSRLADFAQQRQPVLARHLEVGQDDLRSMGQHRFQGLLAVFGYLDLVTPGTEQFRPTITSGAIVLGD